MTKKPFIKYVVTHGGIAHMDEECAVALAMAEWGHVPCYRREPTEAELDDPEVAVVDVGLRHEPELKNFDHHQLSAKDAACAFSLLCEHLGYADVLSKHTRWYDSMRVLDAQGPYSWARKFGYKTFPFGLLGAIEIGLKKKFEKYFGTRPVDPSLTRLLMEAVEEAINVARGIADALKKVQKEAKHVTVGNLAGIIYNFKDSTGLNEYYDRCKENGLILAFSVTLDDRGDGWCLYRFGDHPELDLSKLRDDPKVTFAHSGGFIAKTEDVGLQYAMDLVAKAIAVPADSKKIGGRGTCLDCGCSDFVEGVACPNCD